MWHPRQISQPVEWLVTVPGRSEPCAVLRRLKINGVETIRAVTWAPTSAGRQLIGYFKNLDAAAEAAWRRYCDDSRSQHEIASRLHGGRDRGGPSARA